MIQKAEANGLKPVLLLFYDHEPAGLKITRTFRKNLKDCERGTGWNPEGLIIDRFGLNAEDIEQYGSIWIENLRTSSGRMSRDSEYIETYGHRKCESNALFKNDETLKAGEEICRKAIEKYYGEDALQRFSEKEEASKEKLKEVYDDPVWKNLYSSLDQIINNFDSVKENEEEQPKPVTVEKEVEVAVDNKYYGRCPKCSVSFNYDASVVGRLVRCRFCNLPMKLKRARGAEGG